jgi:hypothetical protein
VPANCPARALAVTGTTGERIHAAWLPPGFELRGGETDLGAQGGAQYFRLGGADPPFVLLSRFHSTQPLRDLIVAAGIGTTRPVAVHGHAGLFTDRGLGPPSTLAIGWTESPGIELRVQAHGLTPADALRVANSVEYTPGGSFTYPDRPRVTVIRLQALAALGTPSPDDEHAALTSFGEFISMRAHDANHRPDIDPGVAVAQPVWVVWTTDGDARSVTATIIDAESGSTITTAPKVDPRALDSLTDRSVPNCSPPFGVLTRSEAQYLQPPAQGGTVLMKLSTAGALGATSTLAPLSQCSIDRCDPSVPFWLFIFRASDHRYLDQGFGAPTGPVGLTGPTAQRPTTTIKAGSWELAGFDARTGPQDTYVAGSYASVGTVPADLLAIRDLSPA